MKLFIYLTYIYLTLYTIYFLALSIISLKHSRKRREDIPKRYNNLCVVVYSHNNEATVENLIKQLKHQTYPSSNYTIQLILDNCSDKSEFLFQGDLSVTIMNIKNVDTIGKDQAFSIVTEKYSTIRDLDAYVFLDAKYYVGNDFLEKINESLQKDDVVVGATTLICDGEIGLIDNIKYSYNQYKNNFLLKTRNDMGFSNLVNSEILAMKKSVIDEIGSLNFRTTNDELKYTLELSKMGIRTGFNSEVKIYIGLNEYDFKIPSLSVRTALFFENLFKIGTKNLNYKELVCSLIYPNCITLALGYFLVFSFAFQVKCLLNYYVVGAEIALFVIAFCLSLLNAKIHSKEHLYLFLYPAYALCKVIYNFPPLRFIRKCLFKSEENTKIEKLDLQVYVSDGKKYFPCKLQIVSEAKFTSVVFINKNKKYRTKNHIRVVDAIQEIAQKLESYGYYLRLCQCCKYFEPNIDGTVNQIKGFCKYPFTNRTPGDILSTMVWNACDAYEKVNVVNFFDAISKKEDN